MKAPALSEQQDAPEAAPRKLQARGLARRELIMDAAEAVFSERGYYGSSLREVAARSGAALGLINHYFASKEELFNAVVDRKRGLLTREIMESLDAVDIGPETGVQLVIRAFIGPFLSACVREKGVLHSYIRLTSHFMSSYGVAEIRPALASLKPISDIFAARLRQAMPAAGEAEFRIAVYLIEAALIFMVQDNGFLESISDGRYDADRLGELIEPAALFFAAGAAALERTGRPD